MARDSQVELHDEADFEKMRRAGQLAAEVLDYVTEIIAPGITTEYINEVCHKMIIAANAVPAPLNYKGFPKSVCTSINHVICHGIPSENAKLKDGDIINVDVTVILDGWYGDSSRTYWVGEPSIKAKRLTKVAYECMMLGIDQVKPGNKFGDIGYAIQQHAEKHGYSTVRDYCGHGIGKFFHGPPSVAHFGQKNTGNVIEEGMFFTVEPMINAGKYHTKLSRHDGWTVTTKDLSLSAQFEHTIGVTSDGCEIFTASKKEFTQPPYLLNNK